MVSSKGAKLIKLHPIPCFYKMSVTLDDLKDFCPICLTSIGELNINDISYCSWCNKITCNPCFEEYKDNEWKKWMLDFSMESDLNVACTMCRKLMPRTQKEMDDIHFKKALEGDRINQYRVASKYYEGTKLI